MGAEVVVAVSAAPAAVLAGMSVESVKIGDLEDLELLAAERRAQLVVGNSHAVACAERLGVPVLRAGFPLYDVIGAYQKTWIGYRGTRQALFDLANLVIHFSHEDIPVYRSAYAQKIDAISSPGSVSCH
jgi:nitrogenase molybdenum-iron protein NifN